MNIHDYLGQSLKSDGLVELFELYDVDVAYSYDRLYENTPDAYHGSISGLGLQFMFNEYQILTTIFVYTTETDRFNAADTSNMGLTTFDSKAEAIKHASENNQLYKEGKATFLGTDRDWIKIVFERHTIHYEYRSGKLGLVTIEVINA
ncbi:hypothetical protein AB833_00160 [Chromatiales bacterium (ex Bugula neritina AB1)]|nr:hypothetical protein AB833_00160 [Chromatiales bacterium (ex Bugula neritina AB1)]